MALSKRSQKLIKEFDEAAQNWGWQVVPRAHEEYIDAKARLERHIKRLERKANHEA